jgi:hypothetical protein
MGSPTEEPTDRYQERCERQTGAQAAPPSIPIVGHRQLGVTPPSRRTATPRVQHCARTVLHPDAPRRGDPGAPVAAKSTCLRF